MIGENGCPKHTCLSIFHMRIIQNKNIDIKGKENKV